LTVHWKSERLKKKSEQLYQSRNFYVTYIRIWRLFYYLVNYGHTQGGGGMAAGLQSSQKSKSKNIDFVDMMKLNVCVIYPSVEISP